MDRGIQFDMLNQALVSTLVVNIPDYSKSFIVEIDSSGKGIRVF